ncbi:MAG: carbamoyl phosphate synthase large subunit [Deltaproteobacteria bacterium CG11_big_fil_rev_8_21_14_0_20_42_23]|nr:MAG: carbamoyl phosphate synthase large subunit [Deltaproteobacteria bacterium CG11_big_fil_rev_8_21_14_0_20_42_23]PJC63464.1 MAG: carbamoyl phosphate synthase large subunit [Deltaproteobacteria bacterium CG_4_9_14_0_2_um_filter_42_21]
MKKKIEKVLVLGSGALKIGEAGEFDYSGSQAIKALKEEGVKTVLVNPNIATIQTSEGLADEVYFLPVTPEYVEKIIQKEKPDGILLSFGGQTALNCGVELERSGILKKYDVQVLGTPVSTIIKTEDRELFARELESIDVSIAKSKATTNIEEAKRAALEIGYPVMVRIAYALGGLGSGVCTDEKALLEKITAAFKYTNQILVEESLKGWKEVEYEIVRDKEDNCIAVCNMENFDPLGIHTGESIVVAPSQTLTNHEYHLLREVSIRTVKHLGIVGECNVQFALDPKSSRYRVIEVNARLSRSSALASKATGYPLAFVAAKIALGKSLLEIKNSVTGSTKACFEPALDYVVVKIPRWDLKKFRMVSKKLGSGMKSVGEIMAIGRKFEEALQKGLRMLEIGVDGLAASDQIQFKNLNQEIAAPTDERVFAVYQALLAGSDIDQLYKLSSIDPWFLSKLNNIANIEKSLQKADLFSEKTETSNALLKKAKEFGFSDKQIAKICKKEEADVRALRKKIGLLPFIKQVDTLAAEYPAQTNYLYSTYNGAESDVSFESGKQKKVMVLGSGAYRIGSSVEFDWCCVSCVQSLRKMGYQTLLVNCNPETVSTDYDECDRLYFEEITFETILDIYEKEKPSGIILAMGGQVANNLATKLSAEGVTLLGTQAKYIDNAENRHLFSGLLDKLHIVQPAWEELASLNDAISFANKVGYPVLVRPSYVLSGAAMAVATTDEQLKDFLEKATNLSPDYPVVISQYVLGAKEIEIDAVAKDGELKAYVISEHVENAGVHSGDATIVVPPQRMYLETLRKIKRIASDIAKALYIHGPFNIQFLAKDNGVSVIECNLRASRSFPFVSKVCGENLIDLATQVIMNQPLPEIKLKPFNLDYVGVKAPQFSFTRLEGADPTLSVEMSSTGEVGCIGDDFEDAFLKALMSVGFKFPIHSVLISAGPDESKVDLLESSRILTQMGITVYATQATADYLMQHDVKVQTLLSLSEQSDSVVDFIRDGKIDLVINIPNSYQRQSITDGYNIRRAAADFGVPLITNLQLAKRLVESIHRKPLEALSIKPWSSYH